MAYQNKGAMAATIVVAASDSLNKAAANYVCDGTADDVEIQEAIDALPAGGGKVVLLDGVFVISNKIEYPSIFEMQGQGIATIIKLANNTNPDGVPLGVIGLLTNKDQVAGNNKVYIHDLAIDGNKLGGNGGGNYNYGIRHIVGSDLRFEGLFITSGSGVGISVSDATDIAIKDNRITDMGACGIGADYLRSCVIMGNIIDDTDDEGIDINHTGGVGGDIVISGNILNLSNNHDESGIEISYNTYGMQRIIITNNIISEYYIGIFIKGSNGDVATGKQTQESIIVSGNHTFSNRLHGIYLLALYGAVVSNNISELNADNGIRVTGDTVTRLRVNSSVLGNIVSQNMQEGIFIERADSCTVSGNDVGLNTKDGIFFSYSLNSICVGNIVYNNSQGTYNTYNGITLSRFDYGLCSGNSADDWAADLSELLTADAAAGTKIIQVASTLGFRPKQTVTISDTTPDTEDGVIASIDSLTQLTLEANLVNNYGVAQAAQIDGKVMQRSGIMILDTSNNNSVKGNATQGNVSHILNEGSAIEFDKAPHSIALDLTGAATDIETFHASCPCVLVGYTILYSVATGGGAGVEIRVGRYQDGVALDGDYFDTSNSELNKAKGYSKNFVTADLTQAVIAAGDTVTVGTAGGKADTGSVIVILHIVEMAN
ncbi:MAG: NosD domain-containing protein [Candidatus Omnitrophica bacterium]|nr:NosD domain-containing protein [Candidatus Omnitrophota bacterium]